MTSISTNMTSTNSIRASASTRREIKRQQLIDSTAFKDELLKLETLGFTHLRRNIRLLSKLGDLSKVVARLEKLQLRRLARQERLTRHRAEPTGVNASSFSLDTTAVPKSDSADEKSSASAASAVPAGSTERAASRKHGGKRLERKGDEKVIDAYPVLQFAGSSKSDFPKKISHLFLDGNNMLYVIDRIRQAALRRSQVHVAENMLAQLASDFVVSLKSEHQFKRAVLMFDNANKNRQSNFDGLEPIISARPQFKTSDDMLVSIAQQMQRDGTSDCALFVTSDRELSSRLHNAGALVMKPKHFLGFAQAVTDKPAVAASASSDSASASAPESASASAAAPAASSNELADVPMKAADA